MRRLLVLGVVAAVSACAVAFLPGATAGGATSGLYAFAYSTNYGPLTSCSSDGTTPCPPNTYFNFFLYVVNGNRPVQFIGGSDRTTVPNAFVMNSVDWTITVDGVPLDSGTTALAPPPSPYIRAWSGHWPATVRCATIIGTDPCTVVKNPAVLPGENTSVLYGTWVHGAGEPNGVYGNTFVIHGTLNGTPVDLTTALLPITMTP